MFTIYRTKSFRTEVTVLGSSTMPRTKILKGLVHFKSSRLTMRDIKRRPFASFSVAVTFSNADRMPVCVFRSIAAEHSR